MIIHFPSFSVLSKRLLLTTILAFSFIYASSQTMWVQRGGSALNDEGYAIATDNSGNVYTTGGFNGTASFGNTGASASITSSGSSDIFISKVNNLGVVQWAVRAGGSGTDKGYSIKVDAAGNSFVTGFFNGIATFDATPVTANGGSQDIFIAKYDTDGNLQWVTTAGGSGGDLAYGLALDNSGNILITGEFIGKAQFGALSLTSMVNPVTTDSTTDAFTAKYDATGTALWAKKGSAIYTDRGLDVATDASDNVYVTGQFSDTITFDNTYNNNVFSAIFIIKYDANGNEQWFRKAGGGIDNIAYGIDVDNSSNVYICGDFLSSIIFYGPPNVPHSNTYSEAVFVAKYDANGNFLWVESDGSDSYTTARDIVVDNASNSYIIGNFECKFSEYADTYGQGTFNNIGYQDIFVTKFNASGTRQWAKQFGGKSYDYGTGISLDPSQNPNITGYYKSNIMFPVDHNRLPYLGSPYKYRMTKFFSSTPSSYCSDVNYREYIYQPSAGNSDIFIANAIDLTREPYDFYNRSGMVSCDRSAIDYTYVYSYNHPDTVDFCLTQYRLWGYTRTTGTTNSPNFTYKWSTGSTSNWIWVTTSGSYWYTATSADGCITSSDTIYIELNAFPPKPLISDSKGINTKSSSPSTITLCMPDTVTLTGYVVDTSNTHTWTGPGFPGVTDTSITTSTQGWYYFRATNELGCVSTNQIYVSVPVVDTARVLDPEVDTHPTYDPDKNDTIDMCTGGFYDVYMYDSITDPLGGNLCNIVSLSGATLSTTWSVSPSVTNYAFWPCYILQRRIKPVVSGWHVVTATLKVTTINTCGGHDTTYTDIIDSVYVNITPKPVVNNRTILGDILLCQGDTGILYIDSAGSGYDLTWRNYTGSAVGSTTGDTLKITKSGWHYLDYSSTINGCVTTKTTQRYVNFRTAPSVSVDPVNSLICPNDSIKLSAPGGFNYQWNGPLGTIGGDTSNIWVNTPGFYSVTITDASNCILPSSNPVELLQYGTPTLSVSPMTVLCDGDDITLSIASSIGTTIAWRAPVLVGISNPIQVISSPGTYTADIISCGIPTTLSVTITVPDLSAEITAEGLTTFCVGDSVILNSNGGMTFYVWEPGSIASTRLVAKTSGKYILTTTDFNGCNTSDEIDVVVLPSILDYVTTDGNVPLCKGENSLIGVLTNTGIGPFGYSWTPSAGLSDSTIANPTTTTTTTTDYTLTVFDSANSCIDSDVTTVVVNQIPTTSFDIEQLNPTCDGMTIRFQNNNSEDNSYLWAFSDGSTDNSYVPEDRVFSFEESFDVTITATSPENCSADTTLTDSIGTISAIFSLINVFTPNEDGVNDLFGIEIDGDLSDCYNIQIFNRWGEKIFMSNKGDLMRWNGKSDSGKKMPSGTYYYVIKIHGIPAKGTITLLR